MGGMVAMETANRAKYNYKGAVLIVPALVSTPIKTLKLGWK
jgi:alpha-beta hydrolase superfamily lysophospholipase